MAPLTRARAGILRIPNDLMKTYYGQRCGAGLIIAEATAVSDQGFGWFGAPACYNQEQMEGWKKIVSEVHKKDSKIFLQLWHMGRQSHPSFNRAGDVVAPSPIRVPGTGKIKDVFLQDVDYVIPRELKTSDIPNIVHDYKHSAYLARQAGFDGVEIHGANGYLIDTFLQADTNIRQDMYGGSWENRFRFLGEIVSAVTEIYSPSRVGVRLSPNGSFAGMGHKENKEFFPYVASKLKEFNLGYLHVMDGLEFGFHHQCLPVNLYEMKSNFEGNVMGNVGYTKELANGALRTGSVDMIAFGRPYISNPDLAERFYHDWPLEPEAPHQYWYASSTKLDDILTGYADYPPYKDNR